MDGPDPTRTIPGPNTPRERQPLDLEWRAEITRGGNSSAVVVRQRHRRILAHAAGDTDLAGDNQYPKWVRIRVANPGVPLTPAAAP